ncbi:hypothetical protein SEA_LIBERTYBELL_43 [Streptomyces phage LibertyBell]|nr:hypothetical protein SEA_LIBERTYBELL_43 [Streptomyces phage LibertyBell]
MTKNTTTEAPITVDTLVAEAAEKKLVNPTVPAQNTNEETTVKSVDEFDTDNEGSDNSAEDNKFRAVITTGDEIHEFDSVGGLLKHITVRAFKNRKVQAATGAIVAAGAATWAVTRKKAVEVIELTVEEQADYDAALAEAAELDANDTDA